LIDPIHLESPDILDHDTSRLEHISMI